VAFLRLQPVFLQAFDFLKDPTFLPAFALALAGKLAEKMDKPHEIILKRKT
jgi:hypothetical protein